MDVESYEQPPATNSEPLITMRVKPPSALSFDRHPGRTFLLLSSVLVFLLYARVFASPFVYDDLDQIVNNPNLASWTAFAHRFLLHPVALTTSLLASGASIYRPIFWLSLFLDRAVWGLNAGGFHATNVALHLLNGNLAFALLRRSVMPTRSAAAVCLLWLSFPVNTEVVAWVSGRAYALCTLFILACLLSAFTYIRRGGRIWAIASFVTAACAVLSHESGIVILPLLLLLIFSTETPWSRRLLTTLGSICLAAFGVEALRLLIGVKTFSGLASIKWAVLALWQYAALTLIPLHMSVERSTSISLSEPNRWLVVKAVCLTIALGLAIFRRRSTPALLTGLTWFAIGIAPFCLLMNYQGIAERFLYLSAIGAALAIVAVCSMARQPIVRTLLIACVAVWSVWLCSRTVVRVKDWSDPVRLYRTSLEATPDSPSLHYNLAFSLRQGGDLRGALTEYGRTLQLDRHHPHGFASLGDLYLQLGWFSAAQAAYKQALAQAPGDTDVLLNSGAAYQGAGALSDAESAYQQVLQLDPASSAAHVDLGVLYQNEERSDDAMHQFATAIDLKTKDPVPYYDLAVIFQQAGRSDLALVLYKKALELKPDDADTLRNIQLMQQPH